MRFEPGFLARISGGLAEFERLFSGLRLTQRNRRRMKLPREEERGASSMCVRLPECGLKVHPS